MSTKVNNLGKKDKASKKRVSCPVIPFYNSVKKDQKEEDSHNVILIVDE